MFYNHDLCSVFGQSICLVDLVDCVPLEKKHEADTMCKSFDGFAWILENVRILKHIPIKGQLGAFSVPDTIIEQLKIISP